MSWKEFFKPNVWKILLTLVLLGLSFITFLIMRTNVACPNLSMLKTKCTLVHLPQYACGACAENINMFDYAYGYMIEALFYFLFFLALTFSQYIGILTFPLLVLYQYAIACTIIYVIRKLRKRKQSE